MLVCLTKTGKVIRVTVEQAARLVEGGRARIVGPETATVRPPERTVMDREKR
jgi:hypothetical protein